MTSLEGDTAKLFTKESEADICLEDRIELLQQARNYAQHAKAASSLTSPQQVSASSTALEPNLIRPSTSYVLTRSDHLESNVDCWLDNDFDEPRRLRRDATVVLQQSTVDNHRNLASFWYMLTLLPLVNLHRQGWCSPRSSFMLLVNTVDIIVAWFKQIISYLQMQISRVELDQVIHDCFVVGMDIILGLHALVFFMISFYQKTN